MYHVSRTSAVAVSSRLAVEMSSIGGSSAQIQFVAATATLSTQSHDAPTVTAAPASTINRANDAASSPTGLPSIPTALASSGGPERKSSDAVRGECSQELTTIYVPSLEFVVRDRYGFAEVEPRPYRSDGCFHLSASVELAEVTNVINSASKTAELTAYITGERAVCPHCVSEPRADGTCTVRLEEVAGTPYVALSSISGPAVTLAATSGAPDAFPTSFDGLTVTAIPSK